MGGQQGLGDEDGEDKRGAVEGEVSLWDRWAVLRGPPLRPLFRVVRRASWIISAPTGGVVEAWKRRDSKYLTYSPLRNYTDEIFQKCNIDISSMCILPRTPILPSWEHNLGNSEIRHGDFQKSENSNLLLNIIQEKMHSVFGSPKSLY